MDDPRSLAWTGTLSAVVALGAVLLATLVSPAFAWSENALSNLGVASTEAGTPTTVALFNGGLVLAGLLGLIFAWVLWGRADRRGERVVAGLFALTVAAMAAVGLFHQGTPLHFPAAATFYALITVTLWTDAVVVGGTAEGRRGAVTAWLGATNVLAWVVWAATGPLQRPGLAIPEVIGALVLASWVVTTSMRLSQWQPAPALRHSPDP